MSIILASTFHDSNSSLTYLITKNSDFIISLFQKTIIVVTSTTDKNTITLLKNKNFSVKVGKESRVYNYKKLFEEAIRSNEDYLFYCDFDRLLHWAEFYPKELEKVVTEKKNYDFLLIGRNHRAMETHPMTQQITENMVNEAGSRLLKLNKKIDFISSVWMMKKEIAKHILKNASDNEYALYGEWTLLGWKKAKNPSYIEVEGLEWETPDKYRDLIKKIGYKKWLQQFQTPTEWEFTSTMAANIINVILKR